MRHPAPHETPTPLTPPEPASDSAEPAAGGLVAALQRELQQFLNDLDARYWRNHSEPSPDDPFRKVGTARGTLGGPGNFGSGNLDTQETH